MRPLVAESRHLADAPQVRGNEAGPSSRLLALLAFISVY